MSGASNRNCRGSDTARDDARVFTALKECQKTLKHLSDGCRLRVLAGLRVWIHESETGFLGEDDDDA